MRGEMCHIGLSRVLSDSGIETQGYSPVHLSQQGNSFALQCSPQFCLCDLLSRHQKGPRVWLSGTFLPLLYPFSPHWAARWYKKQKREQTSVPSLSHRRGKAVLVCTVLAKNLLKVQKSSYPCFLGVCVCMWAFFLLRNPMYAMENAYSYNMHWTILNL